MNLKVGDRVFIWYFGVKHVGEVVKIGRKRVRVRFKNCMGWTKEAWRRFDEIQIVREEGQ